MARTNTTTEVRAYYSDFYNPYVQKRWNSDHFHLPLWEKGNPLPLAIRRRSRPLTGLDRLAWKIEFNRGLVRMVDAVVRPANLTSDHTVVDAGCGLGGAVRHLARTVGCRAFGIDSSERQLAEARGKTDSSMSDLVHYRLADCSSYLPFQDNSVDAVFSIESAGHYETISKFLAECVRILKPGGHFMIAELCSPESVPAGQYDEIYSDLLGLWKYNRLQNTADFSQLFHQSGLVLNECQVFTESEVPLGEMFSLAADRFSKEVVEGDNSYRANQAARFFKVSSRLWYDGYIEYHRYDAKKII